MPPKRLWRLPEMPEWEVLVIQHRARTVLCGTAANCFMAILLVSLFLTVWSVVTSRDLTKFAMFPFLLLWVAFFAGPFSLLAGLIGMTLLTRVRRRTPSVYRYLAEATVAGALLGASFPAIAAAFRLQGFVNWGYFALGVVSGALCGLVIGYLSIRRVLGSSHRPLGPA